jgi:hypothetical protein
MSFGVAESIAEDLTGNLNHRLRIQALIQAAT